MIVDGAATCVDGEIVGEAHRAGLELKRAAVVERDRAGADRVHIRHLHRARRDQRAAGVSAGAGKHQCTVAELLHTNWHADEARTGDEDGAIVDIVSDCNDLPGIGVVDDAATGT
jgi:hypothetical protein